MDDSGGIIYTWKAQLSTRDVVSVKLDRFYGLAHHYRPKFPGFEIEPRPVLGGTIQQPTSGRSITCITKLWEWGDD